MFFQLKNWKIFLTIPFNLFLDFWKQIYQWFLYLIPFLYHGFLNSHFNLIYFILNSFFFIFQKSCQVNLVLMLRGFLPTLEQRFYLFFRSFVNISWSAKRWVAIQLSNVNL